MNRVARSFTALLLCGFICQAATAGVVAEFDFDTLGGLEGFSSTNVTGLAADGDFLTGVATAPSNDPQLILDPASLTRGASSTAFDTISFRVRETEDGGTVLNAFDPTGLVVALGGGTPNPLTLSSGFSAADSGNGFFTVSVDISSFTASTITSLRVDPIGGASSNSNSQTAGNTFEVDFIRVTDNAIAIPEPNCLAILSLGGLGLLRRRR